jgi:exopolysaccharide production protein ExoZ
MTSTERLGWLQALRGIAAFCIVVNHAVINLADTAYYPLAHVLTTPLSAGVDLFFVISGFIMVHTTRQDAGGVASATAFFIKRIRRLWPINFVLSLVVGFFTFGWSLLANDDIRNQLLRSIFFIPADYAKIYGLQIIAQSWTLNFEIYFYAVFAISLLFARGRWIFLALWCGVMLLVVPLLYHTSLIDVHAAYENSRYPFDYMKVLTSPIIWEFAGGGVVALIYDSSLRIESATLCRSLVFGSVILAIWSAFHQFYSLSLYDGAAFALMVAAIAMASKTIEIAAPRVLRYLGDISYTLYLQHLFVIILLQQAYGSLGLQQELKTPANLPVTIGICILAAALTSKFLERDMLTWTLASLRWARAAVRQRQARPGDVPV